MQRKGVLAMALGAGVAALGGWFALEGSAWSKAREPQGPAPAATIPVTADTVAERDMPVVAQGEGAIQAFNTDVIRSRIDGQITKVLFTEGQDVRAGDPLFEIDPRPYQAALDQARAARQKDEAQLTSARLDLERSTKLLGNGYQTRQTYDQQKSLVAQLEAAIRGDEAAIESATVNLSYTQIRSPIDGRTGARGIDVGNIVRASDNAGLVTVTQLKPIFATFTLPQAQLDPIRRNAALGPLAVEVYAEADQRLLGNGRLSLIDNQVDPATGTVRLKALFDNADERLWPGEFVSVRLILSVRKDAITVPARAVQQGARGYFAYVVKPDDTAERRDVALVGIQDGLALVEKGLSPGERVVVDGQYRLTAGDKVRVRPPQPAEAAR
jgi:membrane fusion protein, multidrug efflux system